MLEIINSSYEKLGELNSYILDYIYLENYLLDKDHNGRGPSMFNEWLKAMEEEPTIKNVQHYRNQLINLRDATKETINTLCTSVLMIAQNGIKLTLGKPNDWAKCNGTLLSSQGECLLQAIWHGRNLGAHVEGLKAGTLSYKYFEDLASNRGINLLDPNCEAPSEIILKDLLGWIKLYDLQVKDTIHDCYPSPFMQDMTRIGKLAEKTI